MTVKTVASAPISAPAPLWFYLRGRRRRVIYVALYELIAIAAATAGLALVAGQSAGHSGVVAVAASAIAIVWNIVFNRAFERWEAHQSVKGRSVRRRIAHAIGFEGGLVFILVPLFASVFRHADTLSDAMEARCYHGGEGRTALHVLRFRPADLWVLTGFAALTAGVIALGRLGI